MTEDTTKTDCGDFDLTDRTDRSLITDISETFSYLSGKNRAERRKQKLREELVREHIKHKKKPASLVCSILNKLAKSN
ncbi:MAG: hypothetical protein GY875_14360 [Gammaproteobacteria bacterium]|nr:hypothetical protein [Gammaproteobacteria bacterium]